MRSITMKIQSPYGAERYVKRTVTEETYLSLLSKLNLSFDGYVLLSIEENFE